MFKTLPKTSHQLSICEGNFLRLKKILQGFKRNQYIFETINPNKTSNPILFCIIQRTKHTLIIEAKQKAKKNKLNSFIIRIQLCLDAKLAEVISYQGEKPIPYFIGVSKIQSKDEKIQQNRFLTEWLESIFSNGVCSDIKINE
tara:strand:+ start:3550 stop:3978 length:429 start_codon:yes stop_codon:yes gene_type:complete